MKQETPMQEFAKAVRQWNKYWDLYESNPLQYQKPKNVDELLAPYLEKEKQMVVDAFIQGNREVFYDGTEDVIANAYFNNKYNKK